MRAASNRSPESGVRQRKIYSAEATFSSALTSKYQEGLLDIALEFSDGAKTNLRVRTLVTILPLLLLIMIIMSDHGIHFNRKIQNRGLRIGI